MTNIDAVADTGAAHIAISAEAGPAKVLSSRLLGRYAKVMAPTPKEIRQMLRRLRGRLGWSQSFTAAVLGVARTSVVKWEGKTRIPSGTAGKLIFVLHETLVKRSPVSVGDLAEWRMGNE